MPFGACQFLLDGTLVEPELDSDLGLLLLVAPRREENVAPLGWKCLERIEHSSQRKPCAYRTFRIRRVVGKSCDRSGVRGREQCFVTPPVFRQIDCHPIEIGERAPDLPYDCATPELEIGVVKRLPRGIW